MKILSELKPQEFNNDKLTEFLILDPTNQEKRAVKFNAISDFFIGKAKNEGFQIIIDNEKQQIRLEK